MYVFVVLLVFKLIGGNRGHETAINLLLYTQNNLATPIFLNLNNSHKIDPKKKLVIIIHGENSSPHMHYFPTMRVEYLTHYDCSVIMIDWSKAAFDLYPTAARKLPQISQIAASLFCKLSQLAAISLERIHVIGHSIGAHLAGLIGQETITTCSQKIDRITGLEPSGQLYQQFPNNQKLDASDANFVDIIHTDEYGGGYFGNLGTVDFHVNCGGKQTGCPDIDSEAPENNIINTVHCSKTRSVKYMVESLITNEFIAQSCTLCPQLLCKGDKNPEYIKMGEDCPRNSTNRVFWLPTNSNSPYGARCSLYKHGVC